MSDWIKCDGKGEPNLPEGTMVEVKFRDGAVSKWWIGSLIENWDHTDATEDDIVEYKVPEK